MNSILFNNRFAKSFSTLSDYSTRFSALSRYSQGFLANALYSKTTAAALVVTAAVAGITLWHMYRSQAKVNRPVTRASGTTSCFSQSRPTAASTLKEGLQIPTVFPKECNVVGVQKYLEGFFNTGHASAVQRLSSFAKSDRNPKAFCSRIQTAVELNEITLQIGQNAIKVYVTPPRP